METRNIDETIKAYEIALGYYADMDNYISDRAELASVMLDFGSSARRALEKGRCLKGLSSPTLSIDGIDFY